MPRHRIHLKGPWDFAWQNGVLEGSGEFALSGTVSMPREWSGIFGRSSGVARFRRKFHRPSNLDPHEWVMLVLTEVRGSGSIRLNQHQLGHFSATGGAVEFEITHLMNAFNEVTIEIQFDPSSNTDVAGGLYGAVALDIYSDATGVSYEGHNRESQSKPVA